MSAEEAIARAKAIAARLAGTGATLSTTPGGGGDEYDNQNTTTTTTTATDVNSVAEAALAAAFGTAGSDGGGMSSGNGSKRKRWGESSGEGTFVATSMYNVQLTVTNCTVQYSTQFPVMFLF